MAAGFSPDVCADRGDVLHETCVARSLIAGRGVGLVMAGGEVVAGAEGGEVEG